SGWGRERRPVIYVSYDDAKSYIEWLRQKSGKPYRLLSEAEWEFAARGGTSTPYAAGETLAPTQANFDASIASGRGQTEYKGTTLDVGTFPPNPYGLYEWRGTCSNGSTIAGTRAMPARRQTRRPAAGTAP